jgi:pilus assembly protein CpaB
MATEELTFGPRGPSAGRLSLWLGLAAAAAAAVLIAVILSGGADSEKVVPATRFAVVATREIPAQERITPDMLKVDTYELAEVDADAFTSVAQVENRVAGTRIQAGQVIVPSMVSPDICESLACKTPAGMLAVSMAVEEERIVGGNITPGDHVNVIGVFEVPPNTDIRFLIESLTGQPAGFIPAIPPNRASSVTVTLMQNIKVSAVAQNLPNQPRPAATTNAGAGADPAPSEAANPDADTVTLEVSPYQAQIIPIAERKAILWLALRPFGDESLVPVTPIVSLLD